MIYAVLSNFDFVAKFTVKNQNKDFINAGRGVGGSIGFHISYSEKVNTPKSVAKSE